MSNSHTLYRAVHEDLPVIVRGSAHVLETSDGRRLIDLSSGPMCSSLGHNNKEVIAAIMDQARLVPNVFSGYWASESSERAGHILFDHFENVMPSWFGRVIFQQGGGEAVDFACKIAAQYHLEAGKDRLHFMSRNFSFHGVGLLPSALSDNYPRYKLMEPYHQYAGAYVLRIPHPLQYGEAVDECIAATREIVTRYKNHVGAIIIEPIGGPPIGAWPDPRDYLIQLKLLCNEFGILLIFDEILCGSGRCGYMSVAEHYGIWPDILILGKSLTGGYQPVSAIIMSADVSDRIWKGSGSVMFGTTFGAHSMGCAAVAASVDYMKRKGLFDRVQLESRLLRDYLKDALANIPIVCNIRGKGFLWGVELAKPNGQWFSPELQMHKRARDKIMERNVVVYSKGQTMFDKGDFITIAPPFEMPRDVMKSAIANVADCLMELSNEFC